MLAPVAMKEPGFWGKAAVTLGVTVAGGLIVAYGAGLFERDESEPAVDRVSTPAATATAAPAARVRISEFDALPVAAGQVPVAKFTVYNAGDDGADRCVLRWNPVGASADAATAGLIYSDEFAVEPQRSHVTTMRGEVPYLIARWVTTGAQVQCANAAATAATDLVLIRATAGGR